MQAIESKTDGQSERERGRKATFTARAQLVTASVPRGTAPTMDAELPVVAAIQADPENVGCERRY